MISYKEVEGGSDVVVAGHPSAKPPGGMIPRVDRVVGSSVAVRGAAVASLG